VPWKRPISRRCIAWLQPASVKSEQPQLPPLANNSKPIATLKLRLRYLLISLGPIPRSLLRLGCGRPRRGRSGVGDPGYRVACFNAAELAPRIFTQVFAGIACGAASSILLPSLGYPCAILGGCFYLLTHRPSAAAAMFGQGSPTIRPAIKRTPVALFLIRAERDAFRRQRGFRIRRCAGGSRARGLASKEKTQPVGQPPCRFSSRRNGAIKCSV
jgi:hypothetical protein